ncbi:unnamed protein product [Jaminaea pallidilutea]
MPSAEEATTSTAPLFKKKKRTRPQDADGGTNGSSNGGSTRMTSLLRNGGDDGADGDEDDEGDGAAQTSALLRKARKIEANNALSSSSGASLARRNRLAAAASKVDDADDGAGLDNADEYSSVTARYKAGTGSTLQGQDATRRVDWYDEQEGKASKAPKPASEDKPNNDDGVYRGMSSYSSAKQSDSKGRMRGPVKAAPSNIRSVTVMDYQPDVCKDYKETGYCGFGDTCKFLHDRSDYLAGWQMEAAYLPNSTARNLGEGDAAGEGNDDEEDEEDEIPFACLICRQPFTDPVQTRCGHYFCSACAIKRFARTPKCFACGAQTGGIFNSAKKIIERMEKRRRAKEEVRAEKRRGWGQEGDGDGDGDVQGDDEGGEILEGVEIGGDQGSEDDD